LHSQSTQIELTKQYIMMKQNLILPILFLSCIVTAQQGNVGINTTTPRVKLDMNGSFKSSKIIIENLAPLGSAEKDRYLLLNQSISDNRVRRIELFTRSCKYCHI